MNDLIQELLEYFNSTPKDQQERDWEELATYGRVGPVVSDYLDYILGSVHEIEIIYNHRNPEFSVDFCF